VDDLPPKFVYEFAPPCALALICERAFAYTFAVKFETIFKTSHVFVTSKCPFVMEHYFVWGQNVSCCSYSSASFHDGALMFLLQNFPP
jgi:hypothetical protein